MHLTNDYTTENLDYTPITTLTTNHITLLTTNHNADQSLNESEVGFELVLLETSLLFLS